MAAAVSQRRRNWRNPDPRAELGHPARALSPVASGRAGLEVRALDGDLPVPEREDVAAVDLDLLATGRRAGEDPLRHAAVARNEMACVAESGVREYRKHPGERLAHALAPGVEIGRASCRERV